MTVRQALEQVGHELQEKYGAEPIPAAELRRRAAQIAGCQESSVIPSDFCYNRTNFGVWPTVKPLFVQQGRGEYLYIGTGYPYTGSMLHKPRGQAERAVGQWRNGRLTAHSGDS